MEIVPATPSDITELTRIEIESKRLSIPHLVDPEEIDSTRRLQRWSTYFRGESPAGSKCARLVLKASAGARFVGYVAGHLTSRHGMEAEIQSFYVLREHQRKGIGSALLSTLAEWLVGMSVAQLCVGIAAENPYRAFYVKHGAHYLNEHWMYWSDIRPLVRKNALA
jgi:GNAT superfamily N-acetyltransferase